MFYLARKKRRVGKVEKNGKRKRNGGMFDSEERKDMERERIEGKRDARVEGRIRSVIV